MSFEKIGIVIICSASIYLIYQWWTKEPEKQDYERADTNKSIEQPKPITEADMLILQDQLQKTLDAVESAQTAVEIRKKVQKLQH